MYWNYRIVRTKCDCSKEECSDHHKYSIHEVYYESDGTPTLMTEDSVAPMLTAYGCEDETPDDIIHWLERVLSSLKTKSVLDESDIHTERSTINEEAERKGMVEIPHNDGDSSNGKTLP